MKVDDTKAKTAIVTLRMTQEEKYFFEKMAKFGLIELATIGSSVIFKKIN